MHISGRKTEAKAVARRAGEEEAAGLTVKLARTMRLVGVSRSADAVERHKKTWEGAQASRALALKAPTLLRKINAKTLRNRPTSDKHLQRVTSCVSYYSPRGNCIFSG